MSQHFTTLLDPVVLELLSYGGVGVIPTDTVYGLVARATDAAAIARLYSLKQRKQQPGTLIAASITDLEKLGFQRENLQAAEQYWPARLSVVFDASNIPAYLKHTRTDLAVRIPDDEQLRELLQTTGPLMTTSANQPGAPTADTIADAVAYFGDDVDFYVDAGVLHNPPSTIVGFDQMGYIVVHRQGAVTLGDLTTL